MQRPPRVWARKDTSFMGIIKADSQVLGGNSDNEAHLSSANFHLYWVLLDFLLKGGELDSSVFPSQSSNGFVVDEHISLILINILSGYIL